MQLAKKNIASRFSKKSEKKEAGWAGNGLGSGTLQQQKKVDEKNIGRQEIAIGLQPVKKETAPKPIPWGFDANNKPKAEVNKEEQEKKKLEAQERFKVMQQEKKDKDKLGNPSLNAYKAMMNNMDKKEKQQQKLDAVN